MEAELRHNTLLHALTILSHLAPPIANAHLCCALYLSGSWLSFSPRLELIVLPPTSLFSLRRSRCLIDPPPSPAVRTQPIYIDNSHDRLEHLRRGRFCGACEGSTLGLLL